jgi:hypothetical protein
MWRLKRWADWVWHVKVLKGKHRHANPKNFKFMTLPNYPQVDSNITYIDPIGPTQLIPFIGRDVK